jgi:hypothetical protein
MPFVGWCWHDFRRPPDPIAFLALAEAAAPSPCNVAWIRLLWLRLVAGAAPA